MFDIATKIETQRLVLRAFTDNDKEEVFNIMKDKEMSRYTPDEQWKSLEDADEFLKLVFWLYELENDTFKYFFAVTDKQSGAILGICGIGGVEYDRNQNEIFYHIGKRHWGMGYASEVAQAMLKYGFNQLSLNKIIGIVHQENIASNRVMDKIGMRRIGAINGLSQEFNNFNEEYLYSINKEEYLIGIKKTEECYLENGEFHLGK